MRSYGTMERGQPQAAVTTFVLPNDEMQRTRHGNAPSLAADLGVRQTPRRDESMKVYDLRDAHGRLTGFEIDNWWLQPRGVQHVLRRFGSARVLPSSGAADERARFEVGGVCFQVVEPFGDSSRYVVAPQAGVTPLLAEVRQAFAEHRPSLWFRMAGVASAASMLGGVALVVAFRAALIGQAWVAVGVSGLIVGSMGFFLLVVLAVLGLTGGSGASRFQSAVER